MKSNLSFKLLAGLIFALGALWAFSVPGVQATLIGATVHAEWEFTVGPPGVVQFSDDAVVDAGIVPEFVSNVPFMTQTFQDEADFDASLVTLTYRNIRQGDPTVNSFEAKRWTFTNVFWFEEPGVITSITARAGNPGVGFDVQGQDASATISIVGDNSFSIDLPELFLATDCERVTNDCIFRINPLNRATTASWTFDIMTDHTPVPVPEPSTMLLLGFGLAGIGFFGRRKIAT